MSRNSILSIHNTLYIKITLIYCIGKAIILEFKNRYITLILPESDWWKSDLCSGHCLGTRHLRARYLCYSALCMGITKQLLVLSH